MLDADLASLTVTFDFKDPYSYLALAPTLELIDELDVDVRFAPFLIAPMRAPVTPDETADRGIRHRWRRACYYQQDLVRYAAARQLPARHLGTEALYRQAAGEIAAMALNWLNQTDASRLPELMGRVFRGYWDEALSVDSLPELAGLLGEMGQDATAFEAYCTSIGPDELASQRAELIELGIFSSPGYLFEDDVYLGRQHLPLIRARLGEQTSEVS